MNWENSSIYTKGEALKRAVKNLLNTAVTPSNAFPLAVVLPGIGIMLVTAAGWGHISRRQFRPPVHLYD